ncbi:MAG: alpha-D-ribose 1-methylphosphonate 5-triphosphate diphosphatase [Pseudomonadota bacterium]
MIAAPENRSGVFTFVGARVLLPEGEVETTVTVEGGRIADLGGPVTGAAVDARGMILAPAMVDVHGDAFERQLMPRPGVYFPLDTALLDTDRQLAANGIATAYHAVTLGFEPGLRAVDRGRDMIAALGRLRPRLTVENRVQLRWETFATEALPVLAWAMGTKDTALGPRPDLPGVSLAFNDHLTMTMRPPGVRVQDRGFDYRPDLPGVDLGDDALFEDRHSKHAERCDIPLGAYRALIAQVWDRRPAVPATMAEVAAHARTRGIPMLSHDDTEAETRRFYRDLGARTAEFPMTQAPVNDARASGDRVIFGAPNVVRGGSHIGSLSAAEMVEDGTCDALASDYFYPAMLAAVAALDRDRRAGRGAIWDLVSAGPAAAMGLTDRGRIAPGLRADLVLLDWPRDAAPAVCGTWVAGRAAYRSTAAGSPSV